MMKRLLRPLVCSAYIRNKYSNNFSYTSYTCIVCVNEGCPSLEEYLRGFEITLRVLQESYAITRAMYEVCEDAVADGVCYDTASHTMRRTG